MSEAIAFLPPRAQVLSRRAEILADLKELVPAGRLVAEETALVPFENDGFIAYRRRPLAVVCRDTAQVAAVMKYCHRYGIPVVPRGAGTSLSGGANPTGRCRRARPVRHDPHHRGRLRQSLRHGQGRCHQSRHLRCRRRRWLFLCPDPSSQLACTIGGNNRDEFRRRPLSEIRCHHQQPPWRQDGSRRWHDRRSRRQTSRCRGL